MTRFAACAVSLAAIGSLCLADGEVVIGFEQFEPGTLVGSYSERGVEVTPLGPSGLMTGGMLPDGDVYVFDASAEAQAGLHAELPEAAGEVRVSFVLTVDTVLYLDAFDEDGFQVGAVSDVGAPGFFEIVTLEVSAEGIRSVRFGGFGLGEAATPWLEYTPAVAPCNAADLAPPRGVLDFADVLAFLTAFGSGDAEADLAEPFGELDFSDVLAFLQAFGSGCP